MSNDLRPLFAPRSVAVVGASADPSKWGNVLARGALRGAHRRAVFLVNRAGGDILGRQTFRSLEDLPESPELAVISVPANGFEHAVTDALAAGARTIVAISSGLGEHDEEGRRVEQAVAAQVRAAGARMLGPNCLGVFDAGEELDLSWSALPPGPIAFVSQSGNIALESARLAVKAGLGFSRFVSLGNQADLVAGDFFDDLAAHGPTRAVALYVEDFRDGRAFVAAAARATAAGTPVILLSGGVTAATAAAARSHTAALVSDARAIRAACSAAGIVHVSTPKRLVDAAQALLSRARPRGRRVAVYTDGGGSGVVAGDVLAAAGLEISPLSEPTAAALRTRLPDTASVANPVDFAGGGEQRLMSYADVGRILLESSDVDAVLLTGYFGGYALDLPALADEELAAAAALATAASETDGALVVHMSYAHSPVAALLRDGGVPVYEDVESAATALAFLARHVETSDPRQPIEMDLPPLEAPTPGYAEARAFLGRAGVPFTETRSATSRKEALAAATELGYPVGLKAVELLHKSESGGVVLGLGDADALAAAFDELGARLGPQTLSVERMAPVDQGVELIAGTKRDPRFGAIVLVGLGGIYAEILDDVAVALAPIDEPTAERLIRSLRAAPLLEGARGRPPLDIAAAARVLAAVSRTAAACPAILELDVNPLLVLPESAVGLDARIVLAASGVGSGFSGATTSV
ncbi:MAG: acetate--CoA ligase family protein [Actinomycetota bacterium]|nr:acetate--CoA ligase family protein [Actinomycetota bacterium]